MTLALGPVGWTIAAIVAGVTALVVAFNAIHGANMEKATKGISQGFKDGASAADLWGQATLATINGPHKEAINSIDEMKGSMKQLAAAQKDWTYARPSTTAMADSFGAMGRSLADVATNDLPKAQAQFKKFTAEVGFSNTEVQTALNEMDEYKSALVDQADQLGINIRTLQGDIDMQKLANFAIGEGEIAQRKANEERQKANEKLAEAARSFVDFQGALTQNKDDVMAWAKAQADETTDANDSWKDYWDGQKFSMDKYLDDLETQVEAARTWQTNLAKLTTKLPQAVYDQVAAMGEGGAELVAALTDGVNDQKELDRLIASMSANGKSVAEAFKQGFIKTIPKGYTQKYVGSEMTLVPINGNKDGGYIGKYALGGFVSGAGTARSDSIPAMLSNGEYVVNARATSQNRQLLEAINSNQSVSTGSSVSISVYPSAQMNEKELAAEVSRQLAFSLRKGGI
jgi:hypothetical protein